MSDDNVIGIVPSLEASSLGTRLASVNLLVHCHDDFARG
jgi:hypothetical protein